MNKHFSWIFIVINLFMADKMLATNADYKADKIIARYIEVTGLNKPNIENVSYMMEMKQTTYIEGQKPYILESYTIASPLENKYYAKITQSINGQGSVITSVFNGTEGWIDSDDIVVDMDNNTKEATKNSIHYFKNMQYDKQLYDAQYIGETIFEGKKVHKIRMSSRVPNGADDGYAYFDDKTGLYVLSETVKDNKTYRSKVLNYTDVGEGILIPVLAVESNGKILSTIETFRIILDYPMENIDFSRQSVQHKFDAWEEYNKGLGITVSNPIQALAHFNNAIKANPNFIRAHEQKISVLFDMERYDEVLPSCKILKGIQPQNLEADRIEAFTHARLEQLEQARIANERYLAKLEEERKQREEEARLRKEAQDKEELERLYTQEEENRLKALKLKAALEQDVEIDKEAIKREEKRAKRKRFWNKFWNVVKVVTVVMDTTNDVLSAINNNTNYTYHNNYDRRGSYSSAPKKVKTKKCSFCNGTGVNPGKERPAFYDAGHISSTKCNYCDDMSVHYHNDCPSCQGKGEL